MSLPASSVVSNSVVRTFHGSTPTLFWDPSYSNCIGTKIRNNYELSNFSGLVYIYTWIVQCTRAPLWQKVWTLSISLHIVRNDALYLSHLYFLQQIVHQIEMHRWIDICSKISLKIYVFYVWLLTKRDKIPTTEFNPMKNVPFWQWLILPWLHKLSQLISQHKTTWGEFSEEKLYVS